MPNIFLCNLFSGSLLTSELRIAHDLCVYVMSVIVYFFPINDTLRDIGILASLSICILQILPERPPESSDSRK